MLRRGYENQRKEIRISYLFELNELHGWTCGATFLLYLGFYFIEDLVTDKNNFKGPRLPIKELNGIAKEKVK